MLHQLMMETYHFREGLKMDINKISTRAIEIYSTSSCGIKESIAKAREELLNNQKGEEGQI